MKKIAMLTGGGDCPGLNAVIRAVTRKALVEGYATLAMIQAMRAGSQSVRPLGRSTSRGLPCCCFARPSARHV